jgi:hypothetical protein
MNNKAVASIFPVSECASVIHARARAFMRDRVLPNEETFQKQIEEGANTVDDPADPGCFEARGASGGTMESVSSRS